MDLRIEEDRYSRPASLRKDRYQQFAVHDTFVVIRNDDCACMWEAAQKSRFKVRVGTRRERLPAFPVRANDLLIVSDDARLERRRSVSAYKARSIDLPLLQQICQTARGDVLPLDGNRN